MDTIHFTSDAVIGNTIIGDFPNGCSFIGQPDSTHISAHMLEQVWSHLSQGLGEWANVIAFHESLYCMLDSSSKAYFAHRLMYVSIRLQLFMRQFCFLLS